MHRLQTIYYGLQTCDIEAGLGGDNLSRGFPMGHNLVILYLIKFSYIELSEVLNLSATLVYFAESEPLGGLPSLVSSINNILECSETLIGVI
jgi:hypothetical protein